MRRAIAVATFLSFFAGATCATTLDLAPIVLPQVAAPGNAVQPFVRVHAPVVALLHARRCGWLSAQQLGMYLIESATERGMRSLRARVEGIEVSDGRVVEIEVYGVPEERVELLREELRERVKRRQRVA